LSKPLNQYFLFSKAVFLKQIAKHFFNPKKKSFCFCSRKQFSGTKTETDLPNELQNSALAVSKYKSYWFYICGNKTNIISNIKKMQSKINTIFFFL